MLNSSASYIHGYLSNMASSNPLNVSQSLIFFDKSRHESEMLDLKKDVSLNYGINDDSRCEERKLNMKNKRLFYSKRWSCWKCS